MPRERGLTLRSRRQPPAWHLAREALTVIIRLAGQAPIRRLRLSSNVRQQRVSLAVRRRRTRPWAAQTRLRVPLAAQSLRIRWLGSVQRSASSTSAPPEGQLSAARKWCPAGSPEHPPKYRGRHRVVGGLRGAIEFSFRAVLPNWSLERDLHRHGTWPARRCGSSSVARAKHHPGSGPSAQTLGFMNSSEYVYHYTSLESLALILKSGKIRFTRLDRLDDVTEAQRIAGIDFGKYVLVSCWTLEAEDSLPQWHMYGAGMGGVRLQLPKQVFSQVPYVVPKGLPSFEVNDIYLSPISFEQGLAENCLVTPLLFEHELAGAVEYVDNVREAIARHLYPGKDSQGSPTTTIGKTGRVVRYKAKTWAFQNEYRFVLAALPTFGPPLQGLGNIVGALRAGVDHGLHHFDVPIAPENLKELVVRTGPLCTAGTVACIEALLSRWAPRATLEATPLAGTIRRKGA